MPSHALELYYRRRNRCLVPFSCSRCHKRMTSQPYEGHSLSCFQLDPSVQCVWCFGRMSWPKRTKCRHVNHLLACWQTFIQKYTEPMISLPPVSDSYTLDSMETMCPARDWLGRTPLPELPPSAYEDLCPFEIDSLPVRFQNEGLNLAVGCVRTYLALQDSHEFFHCMVRAVALPRFLQLMEKDAEHSRILPFWCWCDGGKDREARYRQHRHMVIVSPDPGRFDRHVWRHITLPSQDKPYKHYKCLYKKPIRSALHLINTLGYLSKQESRCNGTFNRKGRKFKNQNHFWISTPLPTNFRLSCVLQWDGGILELVHQDYRYMKPDRLARLPLQKVDGQWKIAVRDLPGMQHSLVLRVSKELKPTDQGPTDHYLHLTGNRKLYFQRDYSLVGLDMPSWSRLQAESGNLFYSIVGEELWTPSQFQQKCLHALEPILMEKRALQMTLEARDAQYRQEQQDLVSSMRQQQEQLENRNAKTAELLETLNTTYHALLMELIQLKRQYRKVVAQNHALRWDRVFQEMKQTFRPAS